MARTHFPRPSGATAAGYFLVGLAFFGLTRGTLLMNEAVHELPPDKSVPFLFPVPIIAGICAFFIFRGHNWARFLFWIAAGPMAIWGLVATIPERPLLLMNIVYTLVYFVAGGLLATRASHWFFTGRDYRRRPVRAPAARVIYPGGERERRKFEY